MSRLAIAIKQASEDVLSNVGLESLAADIQDNTVSMEQHVEHVNEMIDLAENLGQIVTTMEAFNEPSLDQHLALRGLAIGHITTAGLSVQEAKNIFPSLEADNPNAAWTKFKDFLLRLWEMIKKAAIAIYDFVSKALKKNSLAEGAAILKIRQLRTRARQMRGAISISKSIKMRPAHRYFFNDKGPVTDLLALRASVNHYVKTRDAIQKQLPESIISSMVGLMETVDKFALSGTPAEVSKSIEGLGPDLIKAIAPMFPENLARSVGVAEGRDQPLIYDRAVRIEGEQADYSSMSVDEIKSAVRGFGLAVVQMDHPVKEDGDLGEFKMTTVNEVSELIDLAAGLIDSAHTADMQRQWKKLQHMATSMTLDVGGALRALLSMDELSPDARSVLTLATSTRFAVNRWIASPFAQFDTVNIRVVNAILALAEDQLKNYEVEDNAEQRAEEKRKAEESARKGKKSDDKNEQ